MCEGINAIGERHVKKNGRRYHQLRLRFTGVLWRTLSTQKKPLRKLLK